MKTVWIINHYAIPPAMGGLNRHFYFSHYLTRKGYDVKIFSSSKIHNTNHNYIEDNSLYKEVDIDGVPYTFIKTRNYSSGYLTRILNMLDFPVNMFKVSKLFQKPDVIYSSSPNPLACILSNHLAKKYGCQSIVEVRDLWPESFVAYGIISKKNPLLRLLYAGEKWIYKKADKLIFTIEGGKDYIIEQGWDKDHGGPIDLSKVYYINNGVDLESFNDHKEHYQLEDEDLENPDLFKVVYTGSIRRVNKVDKLVEVAKRLKNTNIRFLLWGAGDQVDIIRQKAQKEKLTSIVFKGRVDKKYIPHILSKSDLNIVLGDTMDMFRFGISQNKLFDYFASGKPVLQTFKVGHSFVEKNSAGVELAENTPGVIAESVEYFAGLKEADYQEYCNNALNLSKEYDFAKLTDKLIEVLEN